MLRLCLVFIVTINIFGETSRCADSANEYFKKIDIREKQNDPKNVKIVKKKLRDLKYQSNKLEKKCNSDTKKYFVESCQVAREKIRNKTEILAREIASTDSE